MKNLNLPALINQVEKEEQAKRDYLVDTRSMLVGTENSESYITIPTGRSRQSFRLNETARQQMHIVKEASYYLKVPSSTRDLVFLASCRTIAELL